jgi:DUF1365 family protein
MISDHAIYRGKILHERLLPKKHRFEYPFSFFHFEIKKLKSLSNQHNFFGYNQKRLLEIRDNDYLHSKAKPIFIALEEFFGTEASNERTLLVSSPRYLGAAFNPVNFYFRIDQTDAITKALVEVNNTFGDRHIYPICNLQKESDGTYSGKTSKAFHVSPFNSMDGHYRFQFKLSEHSIFLGIDLYKSDQCIMQTYMSGRSHTLNTKNLIKYTLLHPFDTALNAFPRILIQATILYLKKKLTLFQRPKPTSPNTLIDDGVQNDPNSKI